MTVDPFDVHTSLAFDPVKSKFVQNLTLTINPSEGSISGVYTRDGHHVSLRTGDIDLRGKVVMPGFVDAHTHIFLHSYNERPAQEQMTSESIPERTVRATHHLLHALLSGFTTYRDLGSEGMSSFDASIRNLVNRQLTPGPRLFVATEALTSTGSYRIRTENAANGVSGPRIADECDGPWGVRKGVRRRVAEGADVIKFYADYRRKIMRFPPVQTHPYIGGMPFPARDANPSVVMFTQEEMDAIVDEARMAGLPVACHAATEKGAIMACKAGVTSVEHGSIGSMELIEEMKEAGIVYVPTLAAIEAIRPAEMEKAQAYVKTAFNAGVEIGVGGDTGVFNHGEGAREMELLIEAGLPVEKVLSGCMVNGWKVCGGEACGYTFGRLEPGARADIIALHEDPREERGALRKISFVMKDGKVWKQDGYPIGVFEHLMKVLSSDSHDPGWHMVGGSDL